MADAVLNFLKGDKVSSNTDYRDALMVNMYAVERPVLGATGYMLNYPGLVSLGTGVGIDRGGNYNDRLEDQYRISGTSMISVAANGTVASLGTVSGTEQVAMPYSFNTQCVIADGKMFLYDSVGGFVEVVDADLGDPIDCVWIDGYYFLTDGEYIYHTDIDDETSIDPLKFATSEFAPDPSLGLGKTQDNKVIVFNRYSTEYFVDTANENFAFTRVETRAQKIGIVATHAKCEVGEYWYITGGRKDEAVGVHLFGLGSTNKVSSREVDKILATYTEPELADMRMEIRMENDVTFILVHLPDYTLCFNQEISKKFGTASAWSILKSDTTGDTTYRAINGVNDARSALWVYGDKQDGTIGNLDNSICTHYGDIVEWILYTPFYNFETASIDQFEIETIPGHNVTDDATASLSLTYDGITYSTESYGLYSYGGVSDYDRRFILRRLGHVSDWVGFKLRGVSSSRMSFALAKVEYS